MDWNSLKGFSHSMLAHFVTKFIFTKNPVLLYLVVFMIFSVPRQTCISTTISENGLGLGLGLTEDYDQDYPRII